jgi:hypothetical protein
MGVGGECHAPASLRPGKTWYPLYKRLGGPPGPVWTDAENLPSSGIDPRNIKPIESHYTDWAILAHEYHTFIIITTSCFR